MGIATIIIPLMIAKLTDKREGLKADSKLKPIVEVNAKIKELNCT